MKIGKTFFDLLREPKNPHNSQSNCQDNIGNTIPHNITSVNRRQYIMQHDGFCNTCNLLLNSFSQEISIFAHKQTGMLQTFNFPLT